MITFSNLDYFLIIFYFVMVLWIGLRTKASDKTNLDYLVIGRTLTLPAFVATLVSTFYGGVLGIGEFTYYYGISSWFLYAFPYYFFIAIFAIFLAKKIRKTKLFTIPQKLEQSYGKKVSIWGAVLIFFLETPAPYVFMMGILIQMIFGTSLFVALLFSLAISIVYLFKGGLNADVRVNIFEFFIMFLGFGVILPFCFIKLGNLDYLSQNLPSSHLNLTGGNSLQYILVWFFMGAWALVDPSFYQRCYAAKNEKTARNGVLISLIFWFIFDCMTTLAGLYARAHFQTLENPTMSYPLLANEILPSGIKAFFFLGMIATIMSTLHSFLFISGTTIGKDIIGKIGNIHEKNNNLTKIGILIAAVVSLGIVMLLPSVVKIWYTIGSLIIPALLIGVVSSYWEKLIINKTIMLYAMVGAFLVSLISFILGNLSIVEGYPVYPFGIEPMYPGLFFGLLVYGFGLVKKK